MNKEKCSVFSIMIMTAFIMSFILGSGISQAEPSLCQKIRSETFAKLGEIPKELYIPVVLVTDDNVGEFSDWKYIHLKEEKNES
jgi:hypothetical protein